MDAISIIIGLIIVSVFMLIFILPAMNTKNREKKMLEDINKLAAKYNSKLDQKEVIGDVMIAVDKLKGILYYYKHQKDNDLYDSMLISEVSRCKLIKQMKQMKSNNENFNPYEKLGLEFSMLDKSKSSKIWLFYHSDENSHLNLDINQLENWEKLIQNIIS